MRKSIIPMLLLCILITALICLGLWGYYEDLDSKLVKTLAVEKMRSVLVPIFLFLLVFLIGVVIRKANQILRALGVDPWKKIETENPILKKFQSRFDFDPNAEEISKIEEQNK